MNGLRGHPAGVCCKNRRGLLVVGGESSHFMVTRGHRNLVGCCESAAGETQFLPLHVAEGQGSFDVLSLKETEAC